MSSNKTIPCTGTENIYTPLSLEERFGHLLDLLFHTAIVQRDGLLGEDALLALSDLDKLDAGDAWQSAPSSYIDACKQFYADKTGAERKYGAPIITDSLKRATFEYVEKRELFHQNFNRNNAHVYVGAGSVQLYESVLRLLLLRPGDIVVVPFPTYGFFLPQIERLGGTALCLDCELDGGTFLKPANLEFIIWRKNRELRRQWMSELPTRMALFAKRHHLSDEDSLAYLSRLRKVKEGVTSDDLCSEIASSHTLLLKQVQRELGLPRVTAFLHVVPNMYGDVLGDNDLGEYARVFGRFAVSVIEDMSYDGVFLASDRRIPCLQGLYERTYTILGISKTFAVADERIGVMLGPVFDPKLSRTIEGTIGFVSNSKQFALAELFSQTTDQLNGYFNRIIDHKSEGLTRKLRFLEVIFNDGFIEKTRVEELREKICAERDVISQLSRGRIDKQVINDLVDVALERGLSHWLKIIIKPRYGFFFMLDCRPLIESELGKHYSLNNTVACFEFFFLNFGVRLLPEEAMGEVTPGYRMRLSLGAGYDDLLVQLSTLLIGLMYLDHCRG